MQVLALSQSKRQRAGKTSALKLFTIANLHQPFNSQIEFVILQAYTSCVLVQRI